MYQNLREMKRTEVEEIWRRQCEMIDSLRKPIQLGSPFDPRINYYNYQHRYTNSNHSGNNYQHQYTNSNHSGNNYQLNSPYPGREDPIYAWLSPDTLRAIAKMDLRPNSAERPSEPEFTTPQRPAKGQVFHPIAASAPPKIGYQDTPTLRSHKSQSVSRLSIDPIRGPPPDFYPSNMLNMLTISDNSIPTKEPGFATSGISTPASASTQTRGYTPSGPDQNGVRGEEQGYASNGSGQNGVRGEEQGYISNGSGQNGVHGDDSYRVRSRSRSTTVSSQQYTSGSDVSSVVPPNPFSTVAPPGQVVPITLPLQPSRNISRHLAQISPDGTKPSAEVALDLRNMPLVESLRQARPKENGVVHIANIPYATTRAEIVAFVGRNARICNDNEEPVHVIMDRVTGKTMDAFIEFINMREAVSSVRQKELSRTGGRGGRLGNRFVTLEVTGQENLMAALFPRAKNVHWHGPIPEIIPADPNDPYNTGFKGFVSSEELVLLVKQVENPHLSTFGGKCLQRPYECLISTIAKYPWYSVENITIADRKDLFNATRNCVAILSERATDDDLVINRRLLKRLAETAFRCPGFTQAHKAEIASICNMEISAHLAPYPYDWHVFKALGPKPTCQIDVLHYYIALIREATTSPVAASLAERATQANSIHSSAFGNLAIPYPPYVEEMNFSDVARIEWGVVESLLRKILQQE